MEKLRLEMLIRRIEPDGTETQIELHTEYAPPEIKHPEMSYTERCRRYFPHLYKFIERIDGNAYERR